MSFGSETFRIPRQANERMKWSQLAVGCSEMAHVSKEHLNWDNILYPCLECVERGIVLRTNICAAESIHQNNKSAHDLFAELHVSIGNGMCVCVKNSI